MTEQDTNAAAQQGQGGQFALQSVYVKDASYEAPNTPAIFREEWTPKMDFDVDVSAAQLDASHFEVVLHLTVTVSVGDKTAFLVEVKQAGIFLISGIPAEQMHGVLHAHCPNVLYPFAREAVASLVSKGGFPQLLLAPFNFEAMYIDRLRQQQEAAREAAPAQ